MVNFTCQIDWASRCPHIWSNVISGDTVCEVFLDKINIWINSLSKAGCTPWCGQASSSHLKAWMDHKGWHFHEWGGGNPSCLTALSQDISFFLPSGWSWNTGSAGLEHARPSDWNCSTGCPGFPTCWEQIWGFVTLHNSLSQFFYNIILYNG